MPRIPVSALPNVSSMVRLGSCVAQLPGRVPETHNLVPVNPHATLAGDIIGADALLLIKGAANMTCPPLRMHAS